MFPSDQQKRLLAVSSANPSLRSVAAPSFSLQGGNASIQGVNNRAAPQLASNMRLGPVQVAHPGGLQIGNQVIQQNGGRTNDVGYTPAPNPFISGLKTIGGFGADAVKGFASPFAYLVNADIVDPARELTAQATGNKVAYGNALVRSNEDLGLGPNGSNIKGGLERLGGNAAQIALDFAAPGAASAANKAVTPLVAGTVGRFAPGLVNTGTKLVGGTLIGAPTGAAYNVASSAADNTLTKKNALNTVEKGAILGAATGGTIDAGLSAANAGVKRLFNPSEQQQIVNVLASEKNPQAVHDFLSSASGTSNDITKQAAAEIAGTTSHRTIAAALSRVLNQGDNNLTADKVLKSSADSLIQKETKNTKNQPTNFTPEEQALVDTLPNPPKAEPIHTGALEGASKPSVISVVNRQTGEKVLYRPKTQEEYTNLVNNIDNSNTGVAGTPDAQGNVFHVTAGNPDKLLKQGYKEVDTLPESSHFQAPPNPEAPPIAKEAIAAQTTPQAPVAGAPEGVANSVEAQPGGLTEAINKSADQNITKLPTEMPKHTNALQRTFLSVSGELSKMGDAGQTIADKLKAMRDTSETGQAWFIKQIPSVLKLKGQDFTDFVDTLEHLSKGGNLDGVSPKIAQAVQEWSAAIPEVRKVAQEAGVEVGDLGPHYFPRNYTELLKNQDGMNKVANQLVKSGQATNIGEALQQLRFMKRQYSTKFGHFENARKFDLPGYDKSRNALISYVEGAFNKIGHAEQFGPKGERASQLVAQLGSEGHDVERASRLLKIANGTEEYNQPGVETTSRAIRAFNRTTKLGLSAILNAGQTVNTAAAGGVARTLKNASKFISKNDRDFVDATGVNADSVLSNLREQTGISGKITGKLTAPGFNAVEKFNRGTAALVGRDTANMLAEKAAQGDARATESLSKGFGITEVPADGVLNPSQQIQAARNFVERTQFKVDPQDLPAWANSPLGKMAAQFRTFSYKQQKFIQDEVLKQAAQGNVQPLIRFVSIGAPVGLATSTVRGFLRGQPPTQVKGNQDNPTKSAAGRFVDALNNAGGFGMGSSALFPIQNVKSARFPQYLASSVLGPTAGLAVQTATNVQQAAAGSPKALGRQGLTSVPIAGPLLANKTIPYKPSSKALAKSGDTSNDTQGGFANFVGNQQAQKVNTADFVKTLSPQEKQYFQVTKNGKTISVTQSMLDAAHAAGQLNDEQYNYATSLHNVYDRMNAQGKASKLPAKLDPVAKQYYDLTGKLNKQVVDDFKNGKNNNPVLTRMTNQVADTLNKQLPSGINGVKPTPQLLDTYAKFQKAQAQAAQDGKPWDDLTSRTKLRGFWSSAVKGSQDQQVQEIYKQSSTQLKDYFIKNNKVSADDVMKAIALDDALFNADLIDSPHFSKSFRKAFGAGMPSGYSTGGSGGSGGGSSSGTHQVQVIGTDGQPHMVTVDANGNQTGSTGLSSFVPSNLSFKTASIDTTPKKLSFKVNLPEDVRGNPRPQKVASTRYTTVRIK